MARSGGVGLWLLFLLLFMSLKSQVTLSQTKVEFLPGFDGPLPFSLHTGYIGVDEGNEVQLFYYFIGSENNPKEDPFLVWITGGPSCSGASALLYEIGPIQFLEKKYNGSIPKLILRKYSWTKVVNMLFVDLPVGTGFSYATTARANYSGDYRASQNMNEFLRKWFQIHPHFLKNPLYLGGDSYSGFTLPLYFEEMSNGNLEGMEPFLNLKGYLLGNPGTDRSIDKNHVISYAHGMGLISDELYESLETSCGGQYHTIDPNNVECKKHFDSFESGLHGILPTMILDNYCGIATPRVHKLLELGSNIDRKYPNVPFHPKQLGAFDCREKAYMLSEYWMNYESVQRALHVRKDNIAKWSRCNYDINYTYAIESSIMYHAKLSVKGFTSLIYSGDHDLIVPFSGTQSWIRSLNYSIVDDWRRWWVDRQIAGFTRTYSNNMTFVTVKGAGHTAPEYKPKECYCMFKRWIFRMEI